MTLAYGAASVTVLVGFAWSAWAGLVMASIVAVLCGFAWMTK